ncbi:hypothetical protein HAX54_031335, partial [Datura stramonium]|nr:hypothetical protein [Datura stramonium]
MEIHNDMDIRVYVQLRKESNDFDMYPLCVNVFDKVIENELACDIGMATNDTYTLVCVDSDYMRFMKVSGINMLGVDLRQASTSINPGRFSHFLRRDTC